MVVLIAALMYVAMRRGLSSQDYYLTILPDPEFANSVPTESEQARIGRLPINSGFSPEELKRMFRESTPAKLLAPVLDDVVRGIPARYNRVPDVFAGIYPSGGFNARVIRTPADGYLILVNYALKKGLWEWAKLVVNALALQKGRGLRPDDSIDRILAAFVESTQEYAESWKSPAFPQYATDEKGVLVLLLSRAAMQFIVAHEYAHILLGHAEGERVALSGLLRSGEDEHGKSGYLTEELDADSLGVEMVMGPSEPQDSRPEISLLGIYYSVAIFEALGAARSRRGPEASFPGVSRRRERMRMLLEKDAVAAEYPIVADVISAIDYLVLHSCARKAEGNALEASSAKELLAERDAGRAKSRGAQRSTADLRSLLDGRRHKTAAQDAEFLGFMRELSRKHGSDDWDGLRALVSKTRRREGYVGILLEHAIACSLMGVRSVNLPWNPDQDLDAGGFVELALTILAADQGRADFHDVKLEPRVRSQVLFIWRTLYGTALGVIGSRDDVAPTVAATKEAMDKNAASLRIANALRDPILMGFSVLAGAWSLERMGDESRAGALRRQLGDQYRWPPIEKGADGKDTIAYPLLDYFGNRVPASLEQEIGEN